MKQSFLLLIFWLYSAVTLFSQGKAEAFPEFIYLSDKDAQMEKTDLFQKYYKTDGLNELKLLKSEQDALGTKHDKFQQFYKGIKVELATSTLHSKNGEATMITGNYQRISGLEVQPQLTAAQGLQAAIAKVGATHYKWEEPLSEHNDYTQPQGELVVFVDFFSKKAPRLAYKYDIYATEPLSRANIYIDANTGEYIGEYSILHHNNVPASGNSLYNGTVNFTAEDTGPYRLRQTAMGNGVQTFNLNHGTNYNAATDFNNATTFFSSDNTGVEAHWASERTYDYYKTKFNRNSYNNSGAVLKSYVHYSNNYFNAFWDGTRMTYGDGNGNPLVTLDICGHEVTHAVTEYSANLVYANEPGALNESFSDIFGEAIENFGAGSNNWLLGDQIGVVIRSMADPNVTQCPDTYQGTFWDPGQEVHTNSGVQNKWFYLISNGESGTNDNNKMYCVDGLGINKAEAIAYRNLTVYLTASSNYLAARNGSIQAARDLYGTDSPEEVSVTNAWYAVGVGNAFTPKVKCPANISFPSTSGICSRVVTYSDATGLANCPTVTRTSGLASGSAFPVGVNTVTYKVTDKVGATATCSFTVTITDTQKPTITCPANQVLPVNSNCQGVMPAYSGTASDNCATPTQSQSPASGTTVTGPTTVTLTATDASGNTGTCQFQVTLNDAIPPTITCPAQQTLSANASCQGVAGNYVTLAIASDNCTLPPNAVTQTPAANSTLVLGNNTVTLKVTDVGGLMATCTFIVRVNDVTLPNITCPSNIAVTSAANQCGANVTYTTPSASDNCSIANVTLVSGLGSGASYPVGVTTNVWSAIDGSGNTRTCSFTVTVNDVVPPVITCPANIVRSNDPGLCGASVAYTQPTASDNCLLQSVVLESGRNSGDFFPIGATTNVWRAFDSSNNSSSCSFKVTVNDTEAPSIVCPPDLARNTDPGQCSTNLGINLGPINGNDNCVGLTITNNGPGVYAKGVTSVVWTATDNNNNSKTCVQTVTIEDREWPHVVCPSNVQTTTDDGDCVATVDFKGLATDNCPGLTEEYSAPSGSGFGVGINYVEFSATDADGHLSSCVFQIKVNARAEICNGVDDDCDGWTDEAEDWPALIKQFAADGLAGETYGMSVDIDGDYAIVGSNQKSPAGQSQGSAYILFRNQNGGDKWGQVAELSAPGLNAGDNFGASVSISGGIAAVGAPLHDAASGGNEGTVYLFYQNANNPAQWDFVKSVQASDADAGDNFGSSVALQGERLMAGAQMDDESGANAGAAYMFYRNLGGADNWGQSAKMLATTANPDDNLGGSIDLDGDYAIAGATGADALQQNAGAAYIFGKNQNGPDKWGQVARMKAGQSGQNDNFGVSVGISGPWAIVGADKNDLKGTDAGAAFVFYKNQNGILNSWGQSQMILDYNGLAGNRFGSAVGIDEPYAVVAAKGDNPFGDNSGRGFVYLLDGSNWVWVDQLADGGGQAEDALGSAAAINGRNIILGAPFDNNGANADEGSVTVYGGLCDHANRPGLREAEKLEPSTSVLCYPVPFSDVLNVQIKGYKASDLQVSILNLMGQEVSNLYHAAVDSDLNLQWRPAENADGLYLLRIVSGDKVVTQTLLRSR